jgi:hypothetical protein
MEDKDNNASRHSQKIGWKEKRTISKYNACSNNKITFGAIQQNTTKNMQANCTKQPFIEDAGNKTSASKKG